MPRTAATARVPRYHLDPPHLPRLFTLPTFQHAMLSWYRAAGGRCELGGGMEENGEGSGMEGREKRMSPFYTISYHTWGAAISTALSYNQPLDPSLLTSLS